MTQVQECKIGLIDTESPIRRTLANEKMLKALADDITINGVRNAIEVQQTPNGRFQVIAGKTRLEAATLAGLEVVPIVIREVRDALECLDLSIGENLLRNDLHPMDMSDALTRFKAEYDAQRRARGQRAELSQDEVNWSEEEQKLPNFGNFEDRFNLFFAKKWGVSEQTVRNWLDLQYLNEEQRHAFRSGSTKATDALKLATENKHLQLKPRKKRTKEEADTKDEPTPESSKDQPVVDDPDSKPSPDPVPASEKRDEPVVVPSDTETKPHSNKKEDDSAHPAADDQGESDLPETKKPSEVDPELDHRLQIFSAEIESIVIRIKDFFEKTSKTHVSEEALDRLALQVQNLSKAAKSFIGTRDSKLKPTKPKGGQAASEAAQDSFKQFEEAHQEQPGDGW